MAATPRKAPPSQELQKTLDDLLLDAALKGKTEDVRALLDGGADVHVKNDEALRWAARYGRTETVTLLLERGADIMAAGGKNLVADIRQDGHAKMAGFLENHLPEQKEKRAQDGKEAKEKARREMLEAAAKGVPPRPSDIARDKEIARIREAAGIRSPFPTMWRSNKPKGPQS